MWQQSTDRLQQGRVLQVRVQRAGAILTYGEALALWQDDPDFRDFFLSLHSGAPFAAYFWEMPPVSAATLDQAFEFVLIDSPALAQFRADLRDFADKFASAGAGETIVGFENLGGDAYLLAPLPIGPTEAYPHLAAFCRKAPLDQQHDLWRSVGASVAARLTEAPLWLSTAGLGVAWLHLRLDSRPKYYSFAPYRRWQV